MKCNINAKGKAVRLVIGAVTALVGLALLVMWWTRGADAGAALLWSGVGVSAGGLFALFEGASGWCALRALGVRTPI